jgi:hypothetical protein
MCSRVVAKRATEPCSKGKAPLGTLLDSLLVLHFGSSMPQDIQRGHHEKIQQFATKKREERRKRDWRGSRTEIQIPQIMAGGVNKQQNASKAAET